MNRDEQRTRAPALPPSTTMCGGNRSLYPREAGGGTWIGVNDQGMALALVNWYSASRQRGPGAPTRGAIIPSLLRWSSGRAVREHLGKMALDDYSPFRLLAVLPLSRELCQWGWDGQSLQETSLGWRPHHCFSSGYKESEASLTRGAVCAMAERDADVGTVPWLRRVHRSHLPEEGPFSICMHRSDACTVSYTEVELSDGVYRMHYHAGNPCHRDASCDDQNLCLAAGI